MRIGNIEGTPQEIRDMFEDQGFKFEDYLGEPFSPFNLKWLIIPALLVIMFSIITAFIDKSNTKLIATLFVLSFASGIWCVCSTNMKFKNTAITIIVAVGLIMLISLNCGYILLKDVPTFIKTITD